MTDRSTVRWLSAVAIAAAPAIARADTVVVDAARDNSLCEDSRGSLSNGAGAYLFAGRTDQGAGQERRRGLVQFDVAALVPAGSTVTSVTLSLNMSRSEQAGTESVALHRVTADWGEGTSDAGGQEGRCAASTANSATWIHRMSPSATWATPGGAFAAAASATTSIPAATGRYAWSSAAMVADVQTWLDQPAQNFGWLLLGNEARAATAKRFDSRENATAGNRPRLTIDYTPPASGATLYESPAEDPCAIIAAPNAIGTGASSIPFTPGTGPLLYYQVDADVDCRTAGPALLKMAKDPPGGTGIIAQF